MRALDWEGANQSRLEETGQNKLYIEISSLQWKKTSFTILELKGKVFRRRNEFEEKYD